VEGEESGICEYISEQPFEAFSVGRRSRAAARYSGSVYKRTEAAPVRARQTEVVPRFYRPLSFFDRGFLF